MFRRLRSNPEQLPTLVQFLLRRIEEDVPLMNATRSAKDRAYTQLLQRRPKPLHIVDTQLDFRLCSHRLSRVRLRPLSHATAFRCSITDARDPLRRHPEPAARTD